MGLLLLSDLPTNRSFEKIELFLTWKGLESFLNALDVDMEEHSEYIDGIQAACIGLNCRTHQSIVGSLRYLVYPRIKAVDGRLLVP